MQRKVCMRRTELALVCAPNGSDVKYVFALPNGSDVKYVLALTNEIEVNYVFGLTNRSDVKYVFAQCQNVRACALTVPVR